MDGEKRQMIRSWLASVVLHRYRAEYTHAIIKENGIRIIMRKDNGGQDPVVHYPITSMNLVSAALGATDWLQEKDCVG